MSLFKRGKFYWYDFVFEGKRYQESTKLRNQRLAERAMNKAKERLAASKYDIAIEPTFQQKISIPTFRKQSEVWLKYLQTRNRRPIPVSSVPTIRGALNKWLIPELGDLPLSAVNHSELRRLVNKMAEKKLAAKTICSYVVMAKQIVSSLCDDDGQPVVTRKWDNDKIDLPIVSTRTQRRVTLGKEPIEALIAVCDQPWERVLYLLCASSGLRISEALALDREHLSDDFSVVYVRQQAKGIRIISCLKTDAAWRDVDLHPSIATILRDFTGTRTGLLFPSRRGTPRTYNNLYHRFLRPKLEGLGVYEPGAGAHCFRRFRAAQLKRQSCPDDLRKFWLGHANTDISDRYALQLLGDIARRRAVVRDVGLGIELDPTHYVFHYSVEFQAA